MVGQIESGDRCIQRSTGFEELVRISEKEKGQAEYIVLIEAEHKSIKRAALLIIRSRRLTASALCKRKDLVGNILNVSFMK